MSFHSLSVVKQNKNAVTIPVTCSYEQEADVTWGVCSFLEHCLGVASWTDLVFDVRRLEICAHSLRFLFPVGKTKQPS